MVKDWRWGNYLKSGKHLGFAISELFFDSKDPNP